MNQTENHPGTGRTVENDDRWQWVLRVAGSRHFAKALRLHDILIYICQRALTEPGASIREHDIGCHALGRKPIFNPNEDNIVRVQIGHLRRKLDDYYATDGKNDPLRITIPRGAYVPSFEPRVVTPTSKVEPPVDIPEPPKTSRRQYWVGITLVVLGMAAGGAVATFAFRQVVLRPSVDPVVLEAWQPLAGPAANVLLSTATPLNMVAVPEGHQTYGSSSYPAPPEAYDWFRQHRPLAPGAKLDMYFTDNMLGFGTMNGVVTTAGTLKALGTSYQILPERVATLSALRDRNAILFGAPVDSEAISRTMEKTPLIVEYEPSVKEFVIRDRTSGEILVPKKDANGNFTESYGLVTVLNTRYSDHGRLGMVIFSGITSAGTHGAAEFFSSPRKLRILRGAMARDGVNGFPAAYQVVVKCTFGSILLLSDEYRSHKILQKE